MTRPAIPPASSLLLAAFLSACSPTYVLRAGWEEAKILRTRRPIHEVVHDTTTPPEVRAKLRLVQDARDFARLALNLDPGKSFTSYADVERDTLILVLSAAPAYRLSWKTWWFPIVGRVPYKGYFDFEAALREAAELSEEGFDTYVRPSSAFSTLGWLPDPLLSTTLRADSVVLVETVIHEITHTAFFPPGRARFNESFANFVGHRGAIDFFCKALGDQALCVAARHRWEDTRAFGRFFNSMVEALEGLYAEPAPEDSLERGKRAILREASQRFHDEVRPALRSDVYGTLDPNRLNNAWLLSRILYYTRLEDFETIYRRFGDLKETVQAVVRAGDDDPWKTLDALIASAAPGRAETDGPAHPRAASDGDPVRADRAGGR
ncbi:MAG: aminopeptidase [Gemmatimonadota bacterium]